MSEDEHDDESLPSLLTMGHPRLAQPSPAVPAGDIATPVFQARLETLRQAMVAYLGIGIAAPQIGWFERCFLMTSTRPGLEGAPESVLEAWINPQLVNVSAEANWAWEGCLSVPGLRGWIRRPAVVAVRGFDHLGQALSREYAGWDARVFQHEYDHLDGMLFPYRAADPRHIVTLEELAACETWPADWPAPGARDTPLGEVLPE